ELLAELAGLGAEARAYAADVADPAAMRRVLAELDAAGRPPRGVVHAAGHLDDAALTDLDDDRIRAVLRPKVAGALVLDALTRDRPLEAFVLYSPWAWWAAVTGPGCGRSCPGCGGPGCRRCSRPARTSRPTRPSRSRAGCAPRRRTRSSSHGSRSCSPPCWPCPPRRPPPTGGSTSTAWTRSWPPSCCCGCGPGSPWTSRPWSCCTAARSTTSPGTCSPASACARPAAPPTDAARPRPPRRTDPTEREIT